MWSYGRKGPYDVGTRDHHEEGEEYREGHARGHPSSKLVADPPPSRAPEEALESLTSVHGVDRKAVENRQVEVDEEHPVKRRGHRRGQGSEGRGVERGKHVRERDGGLEPRERRYLCQVRQGGRLVGGRVAARG